MEDGKNTHRQVVSNYLALIRYLYVAADKSPHAEQRQFLTTCLAQLRTARIFELDPRAFVTLDTTADQYVTEVIGGEQWKPASHGPAKFEGNDGDSGKFFARVRQAAGTIPYPGPFPFDACYFAIGGGGIGCGPTRWAELCIRNNPLAPLPPVRDENPARLLAIVATASGSVFELLAEPVRGGELALYVPERRSAETGRWETTATLLSYPWLLPALLDAINANDTVIEADTSQRLADRLAAQRMAKRIKKHVLPPLYYRVYIQPTRLTEKPHLPPRPREWARRWDVRGHFYTRVLRGTLPLDPKAYRDLLMRRYRVFHALNPLDGEAAVTLMRRRIAPPGPNEWVAVLRGWRDAFVKGPADKPYIPCTYKPRRMLPVARREA